MTSSEQGGSRRISVDLPNDLIRRFDQLKQEWGLRRRGAVLERLLEQIFDETVSLQKAKTVSDSISSNKNDEFDREDDSLSQFNLFEDQNIEFIKEKEDKSMEEVVHDIEDDYKEYEDSFEPESKEITTNDKTKDVVIEELDVYEENESNDSNKKNEYVLKRKERISNHKNKIYNNDSIEQKLAIPAFKRKNINLDEDEGLPTDNSKTIDFSEED